METKRIEYFCAVAEAGSLTGAAKSIGVSHSGLSKALKLFEEEVGVTLFQPKGRGLEITKEGQQVYRKCQDVLRALGQLRQKEPARDFFRLGMSEVLLGVMAPEVSLQIDQPIQFIEANSGDIEHRVLTGDVDFGFTFVPLPNVEVEYLKLGVMRMNAYALEDDPDLPFVVPSGEAIQNPMGFRHRDGWPYQAQRDSRYLAGHFSTALSLARSGRVAIYMPDFVAQYENHKLGQNFVKVRAHRLATSERQLYLVKLSQRVEDSMMKKVCKIIRKVVLK